MIKVCFFLLPLGLPGGDQVDGLPPAASRDDYGTIGEFAAEFLKKLSFSHIRIGFLDFSEFNIDIAEAHARGFAPL